MWDLTISLYYVNYGLRKRCLEHLTDLILPVYKSQVIHQDFIDQIFNLQFTSICIFLCTWIWANVSNLYQVRGKALYECLFGNNQFSFLLRLFGEWGKYSFWPMLFGNNQFSFFLHLLGERGKSPFLPQGQNGHLPLSPKRCNKISMFWNYLAKCPYFETRFLENRVSIWWKSSYLEKFTWNLSSIIFFFFFSKNRVSKQRYFAR